MNSVTFPTSSALKPHPPNANVRTSEGLGYGEIYFSSYHLQAIDLLFNHLIHYFLYRTKLCPMQQHPNVFHILSCALLINNQYNWDIGLGNIFCCHKLIPCWKDKDLCTLSPDENDGSFLIQRKTTVKRWKDHVVLASGEWLCSDLQSLPIRQWFDDPGTIFTFFFVAFFVSFHSLSLLLIVFL